MSKIRVVGGRKLKGEIEVEGSKNAVLPILAATVLNGGMNVIKNCPKLKDVEIALEILEMLGCKVSFHDKVVTVDSSDITNTLIPEDLATEMRSSIIFMGPMLARCGKVTISYPGGCVIPWAQRTSNTKDVSDETKNMVSVEDTIFAHTRLSFLKHAPDAPLNRSHRVLCEQDQSLQCPRRCAEQLLLAQYQTLLLPFQVP